MQFHKRGHYLIQQLNNSSLVNQGQNILHLDLLPENLDMTKIVQIAKLQQYQPNAEKRGVIARSVATKQSGKGIASLRSQ